MAAMVSRTANVVKKAIPHVGLSIETVEPKLVWVALLEIEWNHPALWL
jgi:hypothetical protein